MSGNSFKIWMDTSASKKSSTRIAMNDVTNASVAALPTPSAPEPQWNPRWHAMTAMAAPKLMLFRTPMMTSNAVTNRSEYVQKKWSLMP